MNNAQLINQTSKEFEYYSPLRIVFAARCVMGSINCDPFSSHQSAQRMGLTSGQYITEEENGLLKNWFGNVWMNHPFSRSLNKPCVLKLVSQYESELINQACCITYASTSEKWFQPLLDFPQCYLSPRTNYYLPDGTLKRGVTKGSVITYLGHDIKKFIKVFDGHFGKVKI